jgi:hypothetical protein
MKTNEEALKSLFKAIRKSEIVFEPITRERILTMSELTRKGVQSNPEAYENAFFSASHYLAWCDLIDEHLSFDN